MGDVVASSNREGNSQRRSILCHASRRYLTCCLNLTFPTAIDLLYCQRIPPRSLKLAHFLVPTMPIIIFSSLAILRISTLFSVLTKAHILIINKLPTRAFFSTLPPSPGFLINNFWQRGWRHLFSKTIQMSLNQIGRTERLQ